MEVIVLNNLKEILKEQKISYRKLAEIIGISNASLNNKINGTRHFNAKEIRKIITLLGIPISEIGKYFFMSN